MPVLLLYCAKVSISLAVVYLFYKLLLQRLTFYNSNRWFLLGYSLLSLFIPLLDISPVLEQHKLSTIKLVRFIPAIGELTGGTNAVTAAAAPSWTIADYLLIIFFTGIIIMTVRFIVHWVSFMRLKHHATLLSDTDFKLYDVARNIIPFSFGRSIFLNARLHNEEDLKKILDHEYIHVRQHHSLDVIWCEFLCLFNWFNPFAWLIMHSIRQNLEFIADKKVLEKGIERKQYQYLLLKVLGVPQVHLGASFNLSSLKERILMMNKIKTAKVHVIKFLFMLPLLAVLLVAFRIASREDKSSGRGILRVSGIIMESKNYEALADVRLADSISKIEVVTDERGFYNMQIPVKNVPYDMIMTVAKPGYKNQRVHTRINRADFETVVDLQFIGMNSENANDRGTGFINFMNLPLRSDLQPGYDLVQKQFDPAKHEQSTNESAYLAKQSAHSSNPYWIINGHTYVIDSAGATASVDTLTDIVFVSGVRMTGKEVNEKYTRSMIRGVAASEKEAAIRTYGINHPVMELVLEGGKFSFDK